MLFDDHKKIKGQYLAQFDIPYESAVASAEIKASISGEFNANAEDIFITVNTDNFELNKLSVNGNTSAKTAKVIGNVKGQFHSGTFEASGKISVEDVGIFTQGIPPNNKPDIEIKRLASQFQFEGGTAQDVKLVLTNKNFKN